MKINDFKLERFFAKYETVAPYLLCCSDCESLKIRDLFELEKNSEEDFKELWLGYTEPMGHPKLREEISKLYHDSKPEQVIVFSGAEEGIFVYMNVLLNPSDHVIVQSPCYQSLLEVAHSIGCSVSEWFMNPEEKWNLDINWLKENIKKETKAIILNFPNNPTGYTVPKETFSQIIDIARQNNIHIFSDEVYRWLEYSEESRLPAICDVYEKGTSLGVMSKSFGLPGLRIGWLLLKDQSLYKKIAAFKDYTTICNSAPSEFLSIIALKNKELIITRNLEIILSNLKYLEIFFNRFKDNFSWNKPKAGPLIFPKLNFTQDTETFCLELLNKKGVLLLPGNQFNFNPQFFRIGMGRKNMPEVLTKFEEFLIEYFNNPLNIKTKNS